MPNLGLSYQTTPLKLSGTSFPANTRATLEIDIEPLGNIIVHSVKVVLRDDLLVSQQRGSAWTTVNDSNGDPVTNTDYWVQRRILLLLENTSNAALTFSDLEIVVQYSLPRPFPVHLGWDYVEPTAMTPLAGPFALEDKDGATVPIRYETVARSLNEITISEDYAFVGGEERISLDSPTGGTITLPLATEELWKKPRTTAPNIGDVGDWTLELTAPNTFPGGTTSVMIAPNDSVEFYVTRRADGTTYRWAVI